MDWKKTTATAVLALVVVFCLTGCPKKPPTTPETPLGPDSTWTYATTPFKVWSTAKGNIRYVMNWTDATDTTESGGYPSGETATVTHVWEAVGTYDVKAMAILDAEPAKASEWSPAKSVKVILNQRPVIDTVWVPDVAVKDAPTFLTVFGSDPDGDSLRVIVDWGAGDTTTELFPTPLTGVQVSHVFTALGDATVIVWTQDWKGAKSLPDTFVITVGTAGGVKWYWQNSEEGSVTTSAVIATDIDMDELVLTGSDDYTFVSIKTKNGSKKKSASTQYPEYDFTGHPGFANGHIIAGSDEGELYALTLDDLNKAWRYPNRSPEDSLTYIEWGAPAFNGSNIYIGHDDTVNQLVLIQDAGSQGNQGGSYTGGDVNDAPIIDATGNVIFGTGTGRLTKIDGNLSSPIWSVQLISVGDVFGPILGDDGTIYCTSDSARLYAVNPDSTIKWTVTLDGDAMRPALGQSALFIGDIAGNVYSINPQTGARNWKTAITNAGGFGTTPIVADSGLVYFLDEDDKLFCVKQDDGSVVWRCDCPTYLPAVRTHRPKKLGLTDYQPNPSICANGDIIVVGMEALYCVAGYQGAPLSAAAAWPKWQNDLSNSGKK